MSIYLSRMAASTEMYTVNNKHALLSKYDASTFLYYIKIKKIIIIVLKNEKQRK